MKKIIVLFKTHLDLGFTDFAENVRNQYIDTYIPHALSIARQMRGEKEGFIWTVGSWILDQALEQSDYKEELEEAIIAGDIRWHGLPFTTHTELMDAALFRYGLGISQKLDERFGKKTIAAKMTDVPGHTRAMVGMLSDAGIRFLHIGVNPASSGPKVPALFCWRTEEGKEILVMYNNDYGELTEIGNSQIAVYFAHTGDNRGPQSAEDVRRVYRELHKAWPEAELCAGTLEDAAKVALEEKRLPVISSEIGDTWIHGTGSDPGKVSAYRALLRMKDRLSQEEMKKLYRELLPVPEHTWGRDEKSTLGSFTPEGEIKGEYRYYVRKDFEKVRSEERFQAMERSWEEQRDYVKKAVLSLTGESRKLAEQEVSACKRKQTDTRGWEEKSVNMPFDIGGFTLMISQSGAVTGLEKNGICFADGAHSLGQFIYEVFSQREYNRFQKQYLVSDESWAIEDFGKTGVEKALSGQERFLPEVTGIFARDNQTVIRMKLPVRTVELFGGMEELELLLELKETVVVFDLAWFGKKACRIPEAAWMGFCTADRITAIEKMGSWVDPYDVVENGNRKMHAIDSGIRLEHTRWLMPDTPLFCPEEPVLLNFNNEKPRLDRGFYMNLYNNVWGTNFRMWYDEDARFRFVMLLKEN